jgi:DNA helicase-2/ATP-dependent DNA helicase PcrA
MSGVERPNTSGMWLGTLHSIAYDILRQFDVDSERLVMLDEAASTFRILQHSSADLIDHGMYEALNGSEPQRWVYYNRIHHAERLKAAINRIVEDDLDMGSLDADEPNRSEQSTWPDEQIREKFLDLSNSYEERLGGAVDFSGVQATFLGFLEGSSAARFLEPDEKRGWQGVSHVIVDEYQDTNPVQEAIYMAMCRFGASLTVVGDDDQALYRFRGASVDAMIGFDQRCSTDHPAIKSNDEVLTVTLDENRRSHEGIVSAVNDYVRDAERSLRYDAAKTAKPDLKAEALVEGSHDSFFVIVRDDEAELGTAVADIVQELVMEGDIADLRQVALLAGSTKQTTRSPFRHYANAFEHRDIPMFNPGSKILHRDPWLMDVMGVICHIVDPHEQVLEVQGKQITTYVRSLKKSAERRLASDEELREHVDSITARFDHPVRYPSDDQPDSYPGSWNVLKLFFKILNAPAYSHLIDASGGPHESASSWRMGWITQLIRSFQMAQLLDGWMPHSTYIDEDYYRWRGREPPEEIRGISPEVVDRIYRDLLALR